MGRSSQNLRGNVKKVSIGMLQTPKKLLPNAMNVVNIEVGEQVSVLRIRVTTTTYLVFGDSASLPAVTVTTVNALELQSGTHLIAVTGKFVRTSAAVARAEGM